MKKTLFLIIFMFFIAAFIGCTNTEAARTGEAPDVELTDLNGKTFSISDYKGKVILLNFFASWCPPCRAEMPAFNEIAKSEKNVKIIGIAVSDSPERIEKFVKDNGLTFTVAMDNGAASASYGPITGIPVTVIIDKNFNIAKRYIGARPKETFVSDIETLNK